MNQKNSRRAAMPPPVTDAPTATLTTEEDALAADADDIIGRASVGIPCPMSSPPAPAPRDGLQKWGKEALAGAVSNACDVQSNADGMDAEQRQAVDTLPVRTGNPTPDVRPPHQRAHCFRQRPAHQQAAALHKAESNASRRDGMLPATMLGRPARRKMRCRPSEKGPPCTRSLQGRAEFLPVVANTHGSSFAMASSVRSMRRMTRRLNERRRWS